MSTGKRLGIPFTAVLMLAAVAFAVPVLAQDTSAPPADAAGAPATNAPDAGAPAQIDPETGLPVEQGAAAPTDQVAAPGAIEETAPAKPAENPYGLSHMFSLEHPDPVTFSVAGILAIMSGGSWLLFITKFLSSGALLSQAKSSGRGAPKGAFASLAEDAQAAAAQHSQIGTQVSLYDWINDALGHSIDNISSQLRGGNSFLATVASSAPFVGLFGTVYGILKALLSIGIAGQPSIDKVAGPVGEALIMTAIGLFAAVPAVIFYNVIVGRNRQVTDALRDFAGDLTAQALGASPAGSGRRR